MHPTNNRSSPEWFPCPRSSSKINRRRGFDEIIQIHRRRGFGEIIQKIRNTVGDMVSAKNWGRFWCSWTNRKWPKLIPDCDNSAVNWSFKWTTWRFLGWASSHSSKIGRYAWLIRPCITRETRASSLVVDSGPCYHPLRYLERERTEGRKREKFYICLDVTHTHTHTYFHFDGEFISKRWRHVCYAIEYRMPHSWACCVQKPRPVKGYTFIYICFSGLPTTAPTMVLRQIAAICLDLLLSARSLLVQPKRFNTLNKK